MRIAKLELCGFKSFLDRTVFRFGNGVSCIVGPNGCGKSNVLDAIKWCIGEQSPKSLRGGEMMDVIFAGSSERGPVGLAEVTITLAADDGEPFPDNYAKLEEIEVGRRLHRNGTSEYSISRGRCRRKDVVNLFLDTGVGNNLYSFIEQGRVDRVVSASPAERRLLIDEAAGISSYKVRREEARSRLEATANQLDRAADVADEMGRRLQGLRKQVVRAARFRRFGALIRRDEVFISLSEYAALAADRRVLRERLQTVRAEEAGIVREVSRRETDLTERRAELELQTNELSQRREECSALDGRLRELEAECTFGERRLAELNTRIEALKLEANDAELQRAKAAAELEERGRDLDRCQMAQQRVKSKVADQKKEVALGEETLAGLRTDVEGKARELSRSQAQVAAQKARHHELQLNLAGLEKDVEALQGEDVTDDLAAAQEHERLAVSVVDAMVGKQEEAKAHRQASDQQLDQLTGQLDRAKEEQQRLQTQEANVQRRHLRQADELARWIQSELGSERGKRRKEHEQRLEKLNQQLNGQLEEQEKTARARMSDVLAKIRLRRDEALTELDELRQQMDLGEAKLSSLVSQVGQARARLAALEVQQGDDLPLPESLRKAKRLVDLLDVAAEDELWWESLLGNALQAPVVDGDAIMSNDSPTELLWLHQSDAQRQILGAISVVDTLSQAMAEHKRTGRPAVVRHTGEHIDSLGVVRRRLGAQKSPFELQRAREQQRRVLKEIEARLTEARSDEARLRVRQQELRQELRRSEEESSLAEEEGQREVKATMVEAQRRNALVRSALNQQLHEENAAFENLVTKWLDGEGSAKGALILLLEERRDEYHQQAQQERKAAEDDLNRQRQEIRRLEADQTARRVLLHSARDKERECEKSLEVARKERAEVRLRVVGLQAQLTSWQKRARSVEQANRLREVLFSGQEELTRAVNEVHGVEAQHEASAAKVSESRTQLQLSRHGLAVALTDEATAAERLVGLQNAVADANTRVAEGNSRIGRLIQQVDAAQRTVEVASNSLVEAIRDRDKTVIEHQKSRRVLHAQRDRVEELKAGLRGAEESYSSFVDKRGDVLQRVTHADEEVQRVRLEIELLRGRIDERYQLSLPALLDRIDAKKSVTIMPDEAVCSSLEIGRVQIEAVEPMTICMSDLDSDELIDEAVAALENHRLRLEHLGSVNLEALAEYEDLGRRHLALSEQRGDLEASMTSIRSAIARMNRICRQRFRDAFDLVNENLQQTYPQLVGGGSARLMLTDDEDLLEAGVEIHVQPPGKRLQSLTLLSGGEKAMTAIALLLALFRVRPSPFCVLDEVDAPLDEANGARFNDMVRQMARISQFIIVTHNRKTMEGANTLYGITMATPGVSKLVSVQIGSRVSAS
ncbi:MAG: AAA family ATPase [Proteobacteria bacterium]|nr:AAA family ATPase [Pseudomonadota bacterium]